MKPAEKKGYAAIHTAADKHAPSVQVALIRTLKGLRSSVDTKAIADLIKSGAFRNIDTQSGIDWKKFKKVFGAEVAKAYHYALTVAADEASHYTRGILREHLGHEPTLQFNAENPRVLKWIKKNSAKLVVEVSEETKKGIRQVLLNAPPEKRADPNRIAREVKQLVGLTSRQAQAVQNYRDMLEEKGYIPDEVMELCEKYYTKQLNYRGENITRTELIRAANEGQLEVWNQAADEGLFKKDEAYKLWIVTPDDRLCDFCAPLDGEKVGFEDDFEGGVSVPPLHPQCRCACILVLE